MFSFIDILIEAIRKISLSPVKLGKFFKKMRMGSACKDAVNTHTLLAVYASPRKLLDNLN